MDSVLPSFGSEPVLEPLLQEILKGTTVRACTCRVEQMNVYYLYSALEFKNL